jgi:hypothetical protein
VRSLSLKDIHERNSVLSPTTILNIYSLLGVNRTNGSRSVDSIGVGDGTFGSQSIYYAITTRIVLVTQAYGVARITIVSQTTQKHIGSNITTISTILWV